MTRNLAKKDADLNMLVAKVDVRIAEKSSQILAAPVDNMTKLIQERFALEQERDGYKKAISEIRYAMQAEEEEKKKTAEASERDSQRKLFEQVAQEIRTGKLLCSCGARLAIMQTPRQPECNYGKWSVQVSCTGNWDTCGKQSRIPLNLEKRKEGDEA